MSKEKKLILIPLIIIAAVLIYCWTIFITREASPTWKHHLALGFFLIIVVCFFKNIGITTVATGVYLIMAIFNLIALKPAIYTFGFSIGSITTPDMQEISLGLFILYFILNMDPMIDIHLDYKEKKSLNQTK